MYSISGKYINLPLNIAPRAVLSGTWDEFDGRSKIVLRENQEEIFDEAYTHLKRERSVLLNLPTSYGKTMLGIHLASKMKYATLVICFSDKVREQWLSRIESYTSFTVRNYDSTKKLNKAREDFVICGVGCASKMKCFDRYGTIIVDEIHRHTKTICSKVLLKAQPRYLIGMTATLDRPDGLHRMYPFYFGKRIIERFSEKDISVVKIVTDYRPELKYIRVRGKKQLSWTTMINSISYNKARTRDIALAVNQIVSEGHRVLVLCGRVLMVEDLAEELKSVNCDYDTVYQNKDAYRKGVSVLIGSIQKLGIGFDDETFDTLFMATDVKDVRQNEGRMRLFTGTIYDVVDNFSTFETHWVERQKWYRKRGCKNWFRASFTSRGIKVKKDDDDGSTYESILGE